METFPKMKVRAGFELPMLWLTLAVGQAALLPEPQTPEGYMWHLNTKLDLLAQMIDLSSWGRLHIPLPLSASIYLLHRIPKVSRIQTAHALVDFGAWTSCSTSRITSSSCVIPRLADMDHCVVGAEISRRAVKEFSWGERRGLRNQFPPYREPTFLRQVAKTWQK